MSDYELELKIRNAPLRNMMKAMGFDSAPKLAKAAGVGYPTVLNMVNLKTTALDRWGNLRPAVAKVCDALACHYTEIFPEAHIYDALEQDKFVAQVTVDQLRELTIAERDPMELLSFMEQEQNTDWDKALEPLTSRERRILCFRFRDGLTLQETAKAVARPDGYEVTKERIREIEQKGLRKLRHPEVRAHALKYLGGDVFKLIDKYDGTDEFTDIVGSKAPHRDRAKMTKRMNDERRRNIFQSYKDDRQFPTRCGLCSSQNYRLREIRRFKDDVGRLVVVRSVECMDCFHTSLQNELAEEHDLQMGYRRAMASGEPTDISRHKDD